MKTELFPQDRNLAFTADLERRTFIRWMSAGAMTLLAPGLTSCGGGGSDSGGAGGSPVDTAQRMTTLSTVATKMQDLDGDGLSPLELVKALAAHMATLPIYVATGVDADTLCAWGIFTDGRLHVIANNRDPVSPQLEIRRAGDIVEPLAAQPRLMADARQVELPASQYARLMHSFGKGFPQGQAVVDDLSLWMAMHGYKIRQNAEGDARVSTLRAISGDGFFYINSHGGAHHYDKNETDDTAATEKKLFSIQSSTPVSDVLENMPDFRDDLDNLRLTYFTAKTGETTKNWRGKEVDVYETRYGITANFVSKYWNFSRNSTVFINACFSGSSNRASTINFAAACHDKGAGVYLGWSHVVSDYGSSNAPRYFVDRMLGANQYQPESPKQRAFAWDKVMEDMQKKGYDKDKPKPDGEPTAVLIAKKNPNGAKPHALAPGIHHMEVSERTDRLTLIGDFGTVMGKVFINEVDVGVISWDADRVVCNLPRVGNDGSCGPVYVRVDDRKSNIRRLTQWSTNLSLLNTDSSRPGLKLQGSATIFHRADIGRIRDNPGEEPKRPTRDVLATRNSVLPLTASGAYSYGNCTDTWSGANVPYPAIPDAPVARVLYANMKVNTEAGTGGLGLALGISSPSQSGFQEAQCNSGVQPLMTQGFGTLEGEIGFIATEENWTNEQILPGINIEFNADFSIKNKTFVDADGEVVVTISGSSVLSPPVENEGI